VRSHVRRCSLSQRLNECRPNLLRLRFPLRTGLAGYPVHFIRVPVNCPMVAAEKRFVAYMGRSPPFARVGDCRLLRLRLNRCQECTS